MNILLVSKIQLIYSKSIIFYWIQNIFPIIKKTHVQK